MTKTNKKIMEKENVVIYENNNKLYIRKKGSWSKNGVSTGLKNTKRNIKKLLKMNLEEMLCESKNNTKLNNSTMIKGNNNNIIIGTITEVNEQRKEENDKNILYILLFKKGSKKFINIGVSNINKLNTRLKSHVKTFGVIPKIISIATNEATEIEALLKSLGETTSNMYFQKETIPSGYDIIEDQKIPQLRETFKAGFLEIIKGVLKHKKLEYYNQSIKF
jgi:hypothetical protein